MGLFDRSPGKKKTGEAIIMKDRDRNYETLLEKNFSLRHGDKGWYYNSYINRDMVTELSDIESCLGLLRGIRAELPCDKVCFVIGKTVLMVFNSVPPSCVETGLSLEEAGEVMSAIGKQTASTIYGYQSTCVLKLP